MTERFGWRYYGQRRPPFAKVPGPGEESVWDYPRPPAIVADAREVVVRLGAIEVARSMQAVRVLETASPPTFYLPPGDVRRELLDPAAGSSFCEWKGAAALLECLVDGQLVTPQPGGFYGGWMTPEVVGPVKGDPGSSGW